MGRHKSTMGQTHYLNLVVTDEDFDRALGAETHSGRCMIAQAITNKYGARSRPTVDADYIRLTDPDTGDRLLYRTPPDAVAALINFDAGIRPKLPLGIRARIAFLRRNKRPASEASIATVRQWAKAESRFPGIGPKGVVPADVIDAFKAAHPGMKVARQGAHTVSTSASDILGKTILSSSSHHHDPPLGNLVGGRVRANVPQSRRRTWGSRVLTTVLIEQGWVTPTEAEGKP